MGIVYRPNEAKVKNLKTKDYLGKARLVAASDRSNAFTGFTGSERLKYSDGVANSAAKDDRPKENLSFAASNLVKPELMSRSRQQSEPPMQRNVFPPTPPPEADKPAPVKAAGQPEGNASMSRAQSVRGGGPKPRPLDLGRSSFDRQEEKLRLGTVRSSSERPRRPSKESISARDFDGGRSLRQDAPRRKGSIAEEEDSYNDDSYDSYQKSSGTVRRSKTKAHRPVDIEEEQEDGEEDDYEGSDFDDAEFEMVSRAKSRRSPQRAPSRRPEVRKIRVKVHADDTRYVVVGTAVEFRDFVNQIRQKFALRRDFKIKIKDEDDMITMADQDDLDMALKAAKQAARREGGDMGKLEVR